MLVPVSVLRQHVSFFGMPSAGRHRADPGPRDHRDHRRGPAGERVGCTDAGEASSARTTGPGGHSSPPSSAQKSPVATVLTGGEGLLVRRSRKNIAVPSYAAEVRMPGTPRFAGGRCLLVREPALQTYHTETKRFAREMYKRQQNS